jgi:hypothetical protein
MNVMAFEGVVDNGQIRLNAEVRLPDKTRVYIIVPEMAAKKVVHIYSPRLAHPEQAKDFKMEVIEGPTDANI